MTPPELSRDGPIAEVLEPIDVDLLVRFGNEARVLFASHQSVREIAQLVHLHKPLRRNQRFNYRLASLALRDRELVVDDFLEQPKGFEAGDDFVARFVTIESVKLRAGIRGHLRKLIDHDHLLKVMTQAHLVIVWIVCGRDLYRAGAKLRIDVLVGNDRNLT